MNQYKGLLINYYWGNLPLQMVNLQIVRVLCILALIMALAIIGSTVPSQSQSQAMLSDIEEQSQVIEEQPTQDKAIATITITMTAVPTPGDNDTQPG